MLPKFSLARAAAEFSVIVVGVLVAFAVESWREDIVEDELEQVYLERLATEFDVDAARISAAIDARAIQQSHINAALEILADSERNSDEDLLSVFMASRSVWSRQIGATFQELFGTGRLQIVKNPNLRIELVGFYSWMSVVLINAPGLQDRMPYRDIVRGELDPRLQEAIRACGGEQARILSLPDTNMVAVCEFGAKEGEAAAILHRIRSNPEALPSLRRWGSAFSALESRLEESGARIREVNQLIAAELASN